MTGIPSIVLALVALFLAGTCIWVILAFKTRSDAHRALLRWPVTLFAGTVGLLVGFLLAQALILALDLPWPETASIGYAVVALLFIGCGMWITRVTTALHTAAASDAE